MRKAAARRQPDPTPTQSTTHGTADVRRAALASTPSSQICMPTVPLAYWMSPTTLPLMFSHSSSFAWGFCPWASSTKVHTTGEGTGEGSLGR